MERYIHVAYQQQLAKVEDGSLVLLIGDDKKSVPAIKGVIHGKVAATVLTKIVKRFTGEETKGPLICFPENADCLVLGKEFLIDFDPTTVEFRPDGKWELGLLAVDAGSRMYIHKAPAGSAFATDVSLLRRSSRILSGERRCTSR